jgi:hypothetical protein
MSSFSVRTFKAGDEEGIVELFNRVYGRYGGFVPRTVEYWRWCCLERPDVKEEGVFLALRGDRLRGYLVAGSSGNIWEFCVDEGEREVAGFLLDEALRYFEKIGVSSVNVNVPRDAGIVENLRKAGFGEVPAERMFVTALNPAALVQALAAPRKNEVADKDDEFGFRLHDVPYGVETEFSVKVNAGKVEVSEGSSSAPSVVVELGFMDLLSILFEGVSPGRMLITRRMKVRPFWKFGAVLGFLSAIRLRGSWYFPLSDYG